MGGMKDGELTVQGMILRSTPQGDYDKRLVILSKEMGRMTVFARGARRSKSVLSGKLSPFSFGTFVVGAGSSAYYLKQAEISNYFIEMGQDYERNCYGCYFLEMAEYCSRENHEELMLLKLLYQSIRALIKESLPNELVRYIFELKMMVVSGEYPEVFTCVSCGRKLEEGYFAVEKGGIFCPACHDGKDGIYGDVYIDGSVLYTIQFVISSPIEKLYTFVVKDEIFVKFKKVVTIHRMRYMNHEFKSLAVLQEEF